MYSPVLRCHHASESASSVEKRPSRKSPARISSAVSALEFEDRIQRHNDFGILGAEDCRFGHALRGTVVTFAAVRIDDPDVGDAECEIVVDALLDPRHAIFAGQYFYPDEWRLAQNRLLLFLAENHANVGDAEACESDLYAPFGKNLDIPLLSPVVKIGADSHLKGRVILFSQISLQDEAIDVVAVGAIGCVQVLAHADQFTRGHIQLEG